MGVPSVHHARCGTSPSCHSISFSGLVLSPATRPTTLTSLMISRPGFSVPADSTTFRFLSQACNFCRDLSPFTQNKQTRLLLPRDSLSAFLRGFPGKSGWAPNGAASLSSEFPLLSRTTFVFSLLMLKLQLTVLSTLPLKHAHLWIYLPSCQSNTNLGMQIFGFTLFHCLLVS